MSIGWKMYNQRIALDAVPYRELIQFVLILSQSYTTVAYGIECLQCESKQIPPAVF